MPPFDAGIEDKRRISQAIECADSLLDYLGEKGGRLPGFGLAVKRLSAGATAMMAEAERVGEPHVHASAASLTRWREDADLIYHHLAKHSMRVAPSITEIRKQCPESFKSLKMLSEYLVEHGSALLAATQDIPEKTQNQVNGWLEKICREHRSGDGPTFP